MKSLQSLVSAFAVLCLASVALAADSLDVQSLLTEGRMAYQKGEIAKAKSAFEMVYRMDSRNQVAIAYLRRIKEEGGSRSRENNQQAQLAGVVIPKIEFREATLGSALDYLRKAVEKESGGKQVVNFVVQLPAEQVSTQTVSLNLTNVPFTEAIRYLAELANATIVYDKYAIMVKPKPGAAPVPEPAVAQ